MSDTERKFEFNLKTIGVTAALIVGQGLVQYGITSTTIADHTRRIELMEKRMEDKSLARDEYERRHNDLQQKVRDNELRLRDLERKRP